MKPVPITVLITVLTSALTTVLTTALTTALIAVTVLFGGATALADEPKALTASEGGLLARVILDDNEEMNDMILFGLHGEQIRENCPYCGYIADHSDEFVYLPFMVSWRDGEATKGYNPDLWARIDKRWYRMKDYILTLNRGGKMDFVEFTPSLPLQPKTYLGGPCAQGGDGQMAMGAIGFARTKRFKVNKIDEIRFTANRDERPLKRD